ncbi:transcriptional factor [Pseudoalteromonas sp. SS15]|uniref:transcriptional factor n=1 Tax=Pseudoalteromonas sp. SS15 TaxID=3139393 RepID=UPI003BA8F8F3
MNSHRHLAILELIPTGPSSITVKQLQQKLRSSGLELNERMLQRDLQALYEQNCFGLEKDSRIKPFTWFINPIWRSSATIMSSELAQHYLLLEQLLPQSLPVDVKNDIRNKAEHALNRLNGNKPDWLTYAHNDSVTVKTDSKVIEQIEHAIKYKRAVSAEVCRTIYDDAYWLTFNDLSFFDLKEESGVLMASFMVGALHDKCYQIPLYRIRNIKILQKQRREPTPEQISSLRLATNKGKRETEINLVIKVPEQSVVNLGFIEFGTLINKQALDNKQSILTFKVIETRQLFERLFKASDWLEVIEPFALRKQIINKLKQSHLNYSL